MTTYFLGLDIGGTKAEVLLVNGRYDIIAQHKQSTATRSPQIFLDKLIGTIDITLHQAQIRPHQLTAIGLGIPGQVDPKSGVVKTAVNLNLDSYPLGAKLREKYNIPVWAEKDMQTAVLGAYHQLFHQTNIQNIAYLGIGTGVAAGIMLNGELYSGVNQMAGEIGHIIFDEDGHRCNCGQIGCLETFISGPHITRQANAELNESFTSPAPLYQLAADGDATAQQLTTKIGFKIARAIQLLIMSYDVEHIIIGGGVTRIGAPFLQTIHDGIANIQAQSTLAQRMLFPEKVSLVPPDLNVGLWGAVYLAQQ